MTIATPSYIAADSYPYECSCGERYSTVDAAYHCRKCRNYCVFGYCTHVVDIRDNAVVRGFEPSEERYAVAAASYEIRIAAEKVELDRWIAEERFERAVGMDIELTPQQAKEEAEDAMYAIQDRLMK